MAATSKSAGAFGVDDSSTLHSFTVEQYMMLDIPERTELLEGLVYDLSPKNASHSNVVEKFTEMLVPALLDSPYKARFEQPIAVCGWTGPNAPEIDVAIIARKAYLQPPTAADAITFIEVSDSTYSGARGDRNFKIPLYVDAGVPSWIVNRPLKHVERYANTQELKLPHGVVFGMGDSFDIAGVAIEVASLFDGGEA